MKRALTVGSTLGKQAELIIIIKWQIIFTQFFFYFTEKTTISKFVPSRMIESCL